MTWVQNDLGSKLLGFKINCTQNDFGLKLLGIKITWVQNDMRSNYLGSKLLGLTICINLIHMVILVHC